MKKWCLAAVLTLGCSLLQAQSIDPVSLVIARVIRALDLQVQKLQNQTIWLQHAQQVATHQLSKLKLDQIAGWQNRQKELYASYFRELKTAKPVLNNLPQVKQILAMQAEVAKEYRRYIKDSHVQESYDALLLASNEMLQELQPVINGHTLLMKDADRVLFLASLRDAMEHCLEEIKQLNNQYAQRVNNKVRMKQELRMVKTLNGIK